MAPTSTQHRAGPAAGLRRSATLGAAGAILLLAGCASAPSNSANGVAQDHNDRHPLANATTNVAAGNALAEHDSPPASASAYTPGAKLRSAIERERGAEARGLDDPKRSLSPVLRQAVAEHRKRLRDRAGIDPDDDRAAVSLADVLADASLRATPDDDTAASDSATESERPTAEALRLYAAGRLARLDGRLGNAIDLLRRAGREDPSAAAPIRELGLAAYETDNISLARSALKRAYELGDRTPAAIGLLARLTLDAGEHEAALPLLLSLADGAGLSAAPPGTPTPDGLVLYARLGRALFGTGRHLAGAEASLIAADFPSAFGVPPTDEAAFLDLARDRARLAIDAAGVLLALDRPGEADAALRLAGGLLRADRPADAGPDPALLRVAALRAWAELHAGRPAASAWRALLALADARLARSPADEPLAAVLRDPTLGPLVRAELRELAAFADAGSSLVADALLAHRLDLPGAADDLAQAAAEHPMSDELRAAFATRLVVTPAETAADALARAARLSPSVAFEFARATVDAHALASTGQLAAAPDGAAWSVDRLAAALERVREQGDSTPADATTRVALAEALRVIAGHRPLEPGRVAPVDSLGESTDAAQPARRSLADIAAGESSVAFALFAHGLVDQFRGDDLAELAVSLPTVSTPVEPSAAANDRSRPETLVSRHVVIAEAMLRFDDPAAAIAAAERALATADAAGLSDDDPRRLAALHALARASRVAGFEERAVDLYETVALRDAHAPLALASAMAAAEAAGDAEAVERLYRLLERRHPNSAYSRLVRARALLSQSRPAEAVRLAAATLSAPGPTEPILDLVARIAAAAERPEDAAALAESYVALGRPFSPAVRRLALDAGRDLGDVRTPFRRLVETLPPEQAPPELLALYLDRLRSPTRRADARLSEDDVRALTERFLRGVPPSFARARRLAADAVARGDFAAALEALGEAPPRHDEVPTLTPFERDLAERAAVVAANRVITQRNHTQAAFEVLTRLAPDAPDSAAVDVALLELAVRLRYDETEALLERVRAVAASSTSSEDAVLLRTIGVLYAEAFSDAGALSPDSPRRALVGDRRVLALHRLAARAVETADTFPVDAAREWALISFRVGATDRLAEAVDAIVERGRLTDILADPNPRNVPRPGADPFDIQFARLLASSLAAERFDLSERLWTYVLSRRPQDASALNSFGYYLVERKERLDEALDMLRRAAAAEPDSAAIADSLGWAYYKLGRFEDAADELRRAQRLVPNDRDEVNRLLNTAVIADHLGDALWRLDRRNEAVDEWAAAAEAARNSLEHPAFDDIGIPSIADEIRRVAESAPAKIRAASADQPPGITAAEAQADSQASPTPADRP